MEKESFDAGSLSGGGKARRYTSGSGGPGRHSFEVSGRTSDDNIPMIEYHHINSNQSTPRTLRIPRQEGDEGRRQTGGNPEY